MFYIIEKQEQLKQLGKFDDCFLHIIRNNDNYHPSLSLPSLLYIRPIRSHKGYIFCIDHTEGLKLDYYTDISFWLLENTKRLFVINKKEILYNFQHIDIFDKLHDLTFIEKIEKPNNNCIDYFYNRFPNDDGINTYIPISKWYEYCEELFKQVKPIIKDFDEYYNNETYNFNNTELVKAFFNIEAGGIKINKEKFEKQFKHISNPEYFIYNKVNHIYSSYNLYTNTGRPSNSFNGINFAALNKENGERECFIPRNNYFIEFDINAYHPRLLGKLIDYELPQDNLYENIGIQKEEMFQNIYGGIKKEHPFFQKIQEYLDYIWRNKLGVYTNIRYFNYKELNINNPNKILSYILQSMETYENVKIINKIQEFLKNKKTRLVLYCYDSFLFDYAKSDGELVGQLKQLIEYPVKIKQGKNYHELK